MTFQLTDRAPAAGPALTQPAQAAERRIDWRRLRSPLAAVALSALFLGSLGQALGTVVAGRLAEHPSTRLVWFLAYCVVGAALLANTGRVAWAGIADRAEGALRDDLLHAALHQPLSVLSEQAVGEVLDRVDDDTHEVGALVRRQVWDALGTAFSLLPMWIVAGFTWWPAWFVLPGVGALVAVLVRPLLGELATLKVREEMAWTDHAAAMEEGVNGRDDLRTSLGQPYLIRRLAQLSAEIHRRFRLVVTVEAKIGRRAGGVLHAVLAAIGVVGVILAAGGGLSVAPLVTLFLVTTTFVGQIDMFARHVPDLQAGLGALVRLRQLMAAEPEPVGGTLVPAGPLSLELRDLHFAYDEGIFALRGIDLRVPAGHTCALVGRSGSGKSTLAALVSRAIDPAPGSVFVGGADVCELDLQSLRRAVGVVTQRTEILAGTLAENIALFAELPREQIQAAVDELALTDWVGALPAGLDTLLGPAGTSLSAGEEQLVAFARLLVRDVQIVVLDEATARMDPVTEARVVSAADRLLAGRTGLLIAHRLSTTARAEQIAVLSAGRIVEQGTRAELVAAAGPFRALLDAANEDVGEQPSLPAGVRAGGSVDGPVGTARRTGAVPQQIEVPDGSSLARGVLNALRIHPRWGVAGGALFLLASLAGAYGAVTGLVWGRIVQDLAHGHTPVVLTLVLVGCLLSAPMLLSEAFFRYPQWWVAVMLRARNAVAVGQTGQHRLPETPAGEVVARSMDADRYVRYADRWVDFVNGLLIAAITATVARSVFAGLVLLVVMGSAAVASVLGRPVAGRSAAASSAARARFGRSLVSALDSARTVKLAAATPDIQRQLRRVDGGRVDAAVREHRVQAVLDGVPIVLVQCGVVAAWAVLVNGGWNLATAILVSAAVTGFDWFGRVAGATITEAPGTRAWQRASAQLAGGVELMDLPSGVDLVSGQAPKPAEVARTPLRALALTGLSAVHDDGTIGVTDVNLTVRRGELVLLLGQIGSGKSSLLRALAGLVTYTGELTWNDCLVADPQTFLRPAQVTYVAQVPRVLSGTFADNIALDHPWPIDEAIADARLAADVAEAGGPDALVGHRGVRLSGGQIQRLALARALAATPELLLADDVSSALDAATEVELWSALRARGATVLGATSKRAALAQADRVVVLADGQVAASGPWTELEPVWGYLAG